MHVASVKLTRQGDFLHYEEPCPEVLYLTAIGNLEQGYPSCVQAALPAHGLCLEVRVGLKHLSLQAEKTLLAL